MKVLYINFTEKVSGGETSLLYYLDELKNDITTIVVSPKKGDLSEKLKKMNIKNYIIPLRLLSRKNPFPFIKSLIALIKLIKKENIDILHANGMASNQVAALASLLTRKPLVFHMQNFMEKKYYKKYFIRFSDLILAVSDVMETSLRSCMKKDSNKNKVLLLKHGVPIRPIKKKNYSLHKQLGIDKDKKIVALIGLIEERKGHEYFIKSANKAKNAQFVVIGDSLFTNNSFKNKMKKLSSQLNANVSFLGYRKDVLEILPEIDVLVVPSINEPLGVIVLEAAAMKVPLVAFKSGGIIEMVDDKKTGFLTKVKDSEDLSDKINILLKNEDLREKFGIASYNKIKKEFNIKNNAKILLNQYNILVKK